MDIPLDGISLYEANESIVISMDWSDGQVSEIDVVLYFQEVEGGQEPSQTSPAIEFAAKLSAAYDSGADPIMPLEEAMQLRDVMASCEPKPVRLSEATLERMERIERRREDCMAIIRSFRHLALHVT